MVFRVDCVGGVMFAVVLGEPMPWGHWLWCCDGCAMSCAVSYLFGYFATCLYALGEGLSAMGVQVRTYWFSELGDI